MSLSAGRARAPGSAGPRESDPTRRRPGGDPVAPHALRRGAGTALRVAWPQTMGRPPCAERGRWHCLPGAAEESSPPFLEGPAGPGLDGALPLQAPGHLLKANERKGVGGGRFPLGAWCLLRGRLGSGLWVNACTVLRPAAFSESDVKFKRKKETRRRLVFCVRFHTSREFWGIPEGVSFNNLFFHEAGGWRAKSRLSLT